MKQVMKINKHDLHTIIKESVKRILNENVDNNLVNKLIMNGQAVYEKGTPEYDILSNMSDWDFSVISCEMEDRGYNLYWDMIGDKYEVTK